MSYLSRLVFGVLSLVICAWTSSVCSQELMSQFLPPLNFKPVSFDPDIRDSIGPDVSIGNKTFKPSGPGPFPAVVLMHGCGGVQIPHIRQHAQELLSAGYVVLVTDSYEPRGAKNCASGVIGGSVGVADAYAALAFLSEKSFVDRFRVYQVGFSWGAIISTMLASPQSASIVGATQRFAATVSTYGACSYQDKYRLLLRDSDRPVLMLLGEKDQELPSTTCFPLLPELKALGSPVEWVLYPGATHTWDQPSQPRRGTLFNERVTADANAKTLEFLARNWQKN
jgi:dienelactone hydrolase